MLKDFNISDFTSNSGFNDINSDITKAINDGAKVYNQGYLLHLLPQGAKQAKHKLENLRSNDWWNKLINLKPNDMKELFLTFLSASSHVNELQVRQAVLNHFSSSQHWGANLPKQTEPESLSRKVLRKINGWLYGEMMKVNEVNATYLEQQIDKTYRQWHKHSEFALFTSLDLAEAADVLNELEGLIKNGLPDNKPLLMKQDDFDQYQQYIKGYLKDIKNEKNKLAEAMFARLQLAFSADNPGYDDILMQLLIDLTRSNVSIPADIKKHKVPIRHGMTSNLAREFALYIQHHGSPKLISKFYKLGQQVKYEQRDSNLPADIVLLTIESYQLAVPKVLLQYLPAEIPIQSLETIYIDISLLKLLNEFVGNKENISSRKLNYLSASVEQELARIENVIKDKQQPFIPNLPNFEQSYLNGWRSILKQYQIKIEAVRTVKHDQAHNPQIRSLGVNENSTPASKELLALQTITRKAKSFLIPQQLANYFPDRKSRLDFIFKGSLCTQYFQDQAKQKLLSTIKMIGSEANNYRGLAKLALLLDEQRAIQDEIGMAKNALSRTWPWQVRYKKFLQEWLVLLQDTATKVDDLVNKSTYEKNESDLKQVIELLNKENEDIDYDNLSQLTDKLGKIQAYLDEGHRIHQRMMRSELSIDAKLQDEWEKAKHKYFNIINNLDFSMLFNDKKYISSMQRELPNNIELNHDSCSGKYKAINILSELINYFKLYINLDANETVINSQVLYNTKEIKIRDLSDSNINYDAYVKTKELKKILIDVLNKYRLKYKESRVRTIKFCSYDLNALNKLENIINNSNRIRELYENTVSFMNKYLVKKRSFIESLANFLLCGLIDYDLFLYNNIYNILFRSSYSKNDYFNKIESEETEFLCKQSKAYVLNKIYRVKCENSKLISENSELLSKVRINEAMCDSLKNENNSLINLNEKYSSSLKEYEIEKLQLLTDIAKLKYKTIVQKNNLLKVRKYIFDKYEVSEDTYHTDDNSDDTMPIPTYASR